MKIGLIWMLCCLIYWGYGQNCLKLNGTECVSCIQNMHLYHGICISDIVNCKNYLNGFECVECKDGFKLQKNVCNVITPSILSEYNSVKYRQLTEIQALMDINYIIGVNQVTSQKNQLQDSSPSKIFAQQGYENPKLPFVRYILDFQIINKDKSKVSYQVLMKVVPTNGKVSIDSFLVKDANSINMNQQASTIKTLVVIPQIQVVKKQNYKDMGLDGGKSDLYLLIFLDKLNKSIEKKLSQQGVKVLKNEIIYNGRLDNNDLIYYWIESRIWVQNGSRVYRSRGSQNRVSYQVKIIQIVDDKGGITSNNISLIQNKQNVPVINGTTIFTNVTNTNNITSNNVTNTNNVTLPVNESNITLPVNASNNFTLPVNASNNVTQNTNTPNSTVNIQFKQNKQILIESPIIANQSNPTNPIKVQTQNKTNIINSTTQNNKSSIFSQLNQTILIKASGFEEINSKSFTTNQPLIIVSDKFLLSKINKSTIKLYKAFIKNYSLKAQYKLYFIDQVINAPNIIVYQGYATFDFLKKRVYVISFGQIIN